MDNTIEQQRAIYGTSLAERFGAVMKDYGLSQRSLAAVLGISAPMLSQLIGARRIKIGNPAVYERLVMLEQRAGTSDIEHVLSEVEKSQPVLTTTQIQTGIHGEANAVSALASVVPRSELETAHAALGDSAPTLSKVLELALREARHHESAAGLN